MTANLRSSNGGTLIPPMEFSKKGPRVNLVSWPINLALLALANPAVHCVGILVTRNISS